MDDKMSFEKLMDEYKEISESLKNDDLSLEVSIDKYKRSNEIYKQLKALLEESKLTIEKIEE